MEEPVDYASLPPQLLPLDDAQRSKAVFSLCNLSFSYAGLAAPVLDQITFALFPGQAIGLSGENGSGKTTFFRCITGLNRLQGGEIWLGGRRVEKMKDYINLRRHVGYVLQDADDQLFFPSAQEDLEFGPLNLGCTPEEAHVRASEALKLVNLGGFENRNTDSLSGGEKKRLAIAAILAMKPRALLLDEPSNGLDAHSCKQLVEVLNSLDCAKIIISHDSEFLRMVCRSLMTLAGGHLTAV